MQGAPDIGGQIRGRGIAPLLVLLQRFRDDNFDVATIFAVDRTEHSGFVLADGAHHLVQLALRMVGQAAGQQFVADHAERVYIASDVEFRRIGRDLLRAHIRESPNELSNVRRARQERVVVRHARHSEIQDLGLTRLVHQDVAGLQVAVDDAALVGMMDGFRNESDQFEPPACAQLVRVAVVLKGFAANEFHGEVGLCADARIGCSRFVDLRDPGVMETAQRA